MLRQSMHVGLGKRHDFYDRLCTKSLSAQYFVVILLCTVVEIALAVAIFSQQTAIKAGLSTIINDAFVKNQTKLKAVEDDVRLVVETKWSKSACLFPVQMLWQRRHGLFTGGHVSAEQQGMCGCEFRRDLKTLLPKAPLQAMFEAVDTGLWAVGIICILAVIAQVFAMIFACCLYSAIGKRSGYMEYA